jgi:hypothetical protein
MPILNIIVEGRLTGSVDVLPARAAAVGEEEEGARMFTCLVSPKRVDGEEKGANVCAVWRPCFVVGCVMKGICAVVSAVRYVARGLVGGRGDERLELERVVCIKEKVPVSPGNRAFIWEGKGRSWTSISSARAPNNLKKCHVCWGQSNDRMIRRISRTDPTTVIPLEFSDR